MPYDPDRHHRRSIRLRGYDYSSDGAYFVTLTLQGRSKLLGVCQDGVVTLSGAGEMIADQWQALPERFLTVRLDTWVIMPDHMHGIILLRNALGQPRHALGQIIGAFKSITTVRYIAAVAAEGWTPFEGHLWQRDYYEHIVRDDEELARIRRYIEGNPARYGER